MWKLGEWLGTLPPLPLWLKVLVDSHKGKAWQRWWVLSCSDHLASLQEQELRQIECHSHFMDRATESERIAYSTSN